MIKKEFVIWQLKPIPENAKRRFSGMEELERMGETVDVKNYETVWIGHIYDRNSQSGNTKILEKIYEIFTTETLKPGHYAGRDLSVGDVVTIRADEDFRAYFCDSTGWKELDSEKWDGKRNWTSGVWWKNRNKYTKREKGDLA